MKTILRISSAVAFGFRAENRRRCNTPGPVMLLPNHGSWLDWLFIAVCLDSQWRFVTSKEAAQVSWVHRFIMVNRFTFPVDTDSPYAVKRMAEICKAAANWCSFPKAASPAPAR